MPIRWRKRVPPISCAGKQDAEAADEQGEGPETPGSDTAEQGGVSGAAMCTSAVRVAVDHSSLCSLVITGQSYAAIHGLMAAAHMLATEDGC